MKNKRLGKGLEALIPQISEEDNADGRTESLAEIEIAKIQANPFQPRLDFDRERLDQLKQSILENGIIQPITVRLSDNGYELIAGERRLRAVQELGISRIPAYVMDVESDDQMLELALVENIQRENLNPIETAKAYQKLQAAYHLTQDAIAQKVGKDRATVTNFIRLLKLPDVIQKSLQNDEISMGHARAIMGLATATAQIKMWKKVVQQGWSVRKVEDAVRKGQESDSSKSGAKKEESGVSSFTAEIEEQLRMAFATKVRVRSSGKGGKIEIMYYSSDDLDRILDLVHKAMES